MLRMSSLFLRTLREDPADAEVPSHKLLVRAGAVRRIAPGIFSWLPLGYRIYRKVEKVVREEMDNAGFQEVHFPALLPRDAYEATNRWTEYGDNLFRLQDRRKVDFLLGPTHEEMFTLMVKGEYSSHKDLPLRIYQIQTKYRDEARPRAGILRGREFVMKDSYSFDIDDAGLEASYLAHRNAYISTFDRLQLDYVIVSAMSGAMGGSKSEEFLALCDNGEDTFVRCNTCGYAANVEAVSTLVPKSQNVSEENAAHTEQTPKTPTIESLVELSNSRADLQRTDRPWTAADTLKNVVFNVTRPDASTYVLAIGLPGNREVDIKRLETFLHPDAPEVFEEDDFKKYPLLKKGYIGPGILGEKSATKIKYLVDPRIVDGTRWISGSNEYNHHTYDLMMGRDFFADGIVEAAEVLEGDDCPNDCGGKLQTARGIEIGHIFQLGRKYAEALDLKVQDENGESKVVTMGSYGIGVSRLVAAIAEQHHDEKGLTWPSVVAPADVHIVATGKDESVFEVANEIGTNLEKRGLEVLLDDRRSASAGVKFNDAELLGIPKAIVVGKLLAEGKVELKDRRSGDRTEIAINDIVDAVIND